MLNKADNILEDSSQLLELSLLGYPKNSVLINKIKNSQYDNIRRLALIRLYLCDSFDGQKHEIINETLEGSEIFVQVGKEEINSIINLGIKEKDVLRLIEKAFLIYFGNQAVQYSFDFDGNNIKKEYGLAIEYLAARITNRQYFEGEIKGYSHVQEIINVMIYLVGNCKFSNLINEFRDFIKTYTGEDSLICEKYILIFYKHLAKLVLEEFENVNQINSVKTKVTNNTSQILEN
ncbi:MAG: hypothetical protein PHZ26_04770 [Candidatus Gracilibacteria bacterium]|nr:hypothetical protein [Candidatus Gracilibacteria bacterium]MDD2909041.1 hypothetical protein [Candidatus Gracilibacteria bacterium]